MLRCLTFVMAILALTAPAVLAQSANDALTAQLLPGWRTADGRHMAAVELRLAPGWKTYWRTPGETGYPPQFDWRGSRNLDDVQISWPTPKLIIQDGVQVIGYKDRVILPLTVTPSQKGGAVSLTGSVDLGVCRDVCIPVTVPLDQVLPGDAAKPDPRIVAAMADRPYSAREAGVGRVACRISPLEGGLRLTAQVDLPATGGREVAVVETDNPQVWVAQGDTTRKGNRLTTVTELYHVDGRAFALDRSGLRITVIGGRNAVDIQGCPAG